MASANLLTTLHSGESKVAVFDEHALSRAFQSFTQAAASLERSYVQLQGEVARLRHELEDTNRDLASSLEENHRIRRHLDRILQGLPCGVLVTEADGQVSLANPEAKRLLDADSSAMAVSIRQLLDRAKGDRWELEYRSPRGTADWITIHRANLGEEEGRSAIFILQDISDRKRLEREHEELSRRQALADMSALLAHEMRNPLGSLELFAGLLADSDLQEEERNWVGQLQAGLRTLAATVNNVLHFHSQPQPGLTATDLGQWLRSTHAFLRPLAARALVRMELNQELDGVQAFADRHRLEQVLLNLALNSFRCMVDGGVLKIHGEVNSRCGAPRAIVEISDNGPGITEQHRERIFSPGFTTCSGSPGLGLAVCKTIMEQHGGSISLASSTARGTIFRLEFPLHGANHE